MANISPYLNINSTNMNLKLHVTVMPADPPIMSWSGSAVDKLKLTKMKILDRLQHLTGNTDIAYKTSAWDCYHQTDCTCALLL